MAQREKHRMMALAFHCCRTPAKASSSSASAVPGSSTHTRWRLSQLLPWLACAESSIVGQMQRRWASCLWPPPSGRACCERAALCKQGHCGHS